MKITKKVFLPKWQKKAMVPLLVAIWVFTTYEEFFGEKAKGDLGITGYIIMTVVLLGVGTMVWFMASGKLPAYIIEEEQKED